jgi:hypothetical protein
LLSHDSLKTSRVSKSFNVSGVRCIRRYQAGGKVEEEMNCRSCNTLINYNYLSDCPQCGCAVEQGALPKLDPSAGAQEERGWSYYLTKILYVLSASVVGMIAGAVVLYFSAGVIYLALASPEPYPGAYCGRGMAVRILSILAGGFLGSVGGTAFSIKHSMSSRQKST